MRTSSTICPAIFQQEPSPESEPCGRCYNSQDRSSELLSGAGQAGRPILYPGDLLRSVDVDGVLILVHLPEVLEVVGDGEGSRGESVLEAPNGGESRKDVEAAGDVAGGAIGSRGEKNGNETELAHRLSVRHTNGPKPREKLFLGLPDAI